MTPDTRAYLEQHPDQAPAELAAALAADYATVTVLDRKALAAFLLSAGLTGAFRAARESEGTPEPIREALLLLQDIIDSGIDYVETTRPEFGLQMAEVLGGLQAAGLVTEEQAAAMVGLAGGYRYDRLTAAEVEQAQAEIAAAALLRTLEDAAQDALQAVRQALTAGGRDRAALAKVFGTALEGG